jgi:hypothetical protein
MSNGHEFKGRLSSYFFNITKYTKMPMFYYSYTSLSFLFFVLDFFFQLQFLMVNLMNNLLNFVKNWKN